MKKTQDKILQSIYTDSSRGDLGHNKINNNINTHKCCMPFGI